MADIVTDAVNGVYNLINDDVSFGNVYAKHNEANLALPGITIGPESVVPREDESFSTDGAHGTPWDVTVSVRIHVAYTGGVLNQSGLVALVDDVILKLKKNHAAITSFALGTVAVEFDRSFVESETIGAQVNATYLTHDEYTQE